MNFFLVSLLLIVFLLLEIIRKSLGAPLCGILGTIRKGICCLAGITCRQTDKQVYFINTRADCPLEKDTATLKVSKYIYCLEFVFVSANILYILSFLPSF